MKLKVLASEYQLAKPANLERDAFENVCFNQIESSVFFLALANVTNNRQTSEKYFTNRRKNISPIVGKYYRIRDCGT